MKLTDMKQALARRDIQLTKSLGQNFLHDANQISRIMALARVGPNDRVLEIGPGLGPLTVALINSGAEVLAIEKDSRLIPLLEENIRASTDAAKAKFQIVQADALEFLRREKRDWASWKLVSNLPYSVASPVMVELAQADSPPEMITVTLQAEVARRLAATPGNKDYGLLTLLVQLEYLPIESLKIPPGSFWPEPDVDSICMRLDKRTTPLLEKDLKRDFTKIVKRALSQRRKMMHKLLKADWPEQMLTNAFAELGISRMIRAEALSIEQFAELTRRLTAARNKEGQTSPQQPDKIFDVVSEADEVIGRNTRQEVHRLGLLHRAVHVLAFNSRGEVFLQKRSMKKDRHPGAWDSSASGHLDSGEEYDACAARELREELGWTAPAPLQRLFKVTASPETDCEHIWVYKLEAEGPFQLNPHEIERGQWFTPAQTTEAIQRLPEDFATAFKFIWAKVSGDFFNS
jgi:16S rRNA (adenine1518-N6/adenine1519-N6)-dimethyltransferase